MSDAGFNQFKSQEKTFFRQTSGASMHQEPSGGQVPCVCEDKTFKVGISDYRLTTRSPRCTWASRV